MLKQTLLATALAFTCVAALADDYYVVVPIPGKTSSTSAISVSLAGYTPPQALVGQGYSYDLKPLLSVTGDNAYTGTGVTWSVVDSTLPTGLYLTSDGTIAGTPTAAGTGSVTARASYKGVNGEQSYQVVAIQITVSLAAATPPKATVGTPYSFDLKPLLTIGGDSNAQRSDVTWDLASSTLPAGLNLNADGTVGGTPSTVTSTPVTVRATYKNAQGQQVYTFEVAGQTYALTSITAGGIHTCALTTTGGVVCWGYNGQGQLGNNSLTKSLIPTPVSGLSSGVTSVSAGYAHSCALTTLGGVKCWGSNSNGQLGNNSTTDSTVPVDVVGLGSGVASVVAFHSNTCAVTTSGGAKCWGDNTYGQLGNNSTVNSNVPVDVVGLTSGVARISVGGDHTCALMTAGAPKCWGNNGQGQLGNGNTTNSKVPVNVSVLYGVASIVASNGFTCALTTAGGAKCWGSNSFGQLGNGYTSSSTTPVNVVGLTSGVASISASEITACAITTSGVAECWGDNGIGQLGNGGKGGYSTASPVKTITSSVVSLSPAYQHTCAVMADGGVKCWGSNGYGELGNNSLNYSALPVDVALKP